MSQSWWLRVDGLIPEPPEKAWATNSKCQYLTSSESSSFKLVLSAKSCECTHTWLLHVLNFRATHQKCAKNTIQSGAASLKQMNSTNHNSPLAVFFLHFHLTRFRFFGWSSIIDYFMCSYDFFSSLFITSNGGRWKHHLTEDLPLHCVSSLWVFEFVSVSDS